ncbi:hypothetical protein BU25DRAFT_425880 [Macroventuria anomochaeta]|uniref:Uncharacterized protein n=1 Tax=Macroventuria anomochaeta TaxID=301207 RepID=A0ACB6RMX4_9PLEO|nr:uncharacterized protein BU25DRAFT_425880 [Macroventuria anomochaeta]KAF2622297.1 hypothetical protein BU25DRAFT_425880 [Macroventuria anomochaeta]
MSNTHRTVHSGQSANTITIQTPGNILPTSSMLPTISKAHISQATSEQKQRMRMFATSCGRWPATPLYLQTLSTKFIVSISRMVHIAGRKKEPGMAVRPSRPPHNNVESLSLDASGMKFTDRERTMHGRARHIEPFDRTPLSDPAILDPQQISRRSKVGNA